MPELPEVETVRRDLEGIVLGKRITAATATNERVTRRHAAPEELVAHLVGRRITGVGRWGKYLLVDAYEGLQGPEHLGELLRARKRRLKDLLMSQTCVAGLGNIYTDEVLFLSGLRHDRLSNSLTDDEVRRLHGAIAEVLGEAVRLRGSSLRDQQYRDVAGDVGNYQDRHRVYAKEGKPCVNCGRPIRRIVAGGRSHFSCEACQV